MQYSRTQDETGNAGLDRFRAPRGDGRVRRDDEERHGALVDGARHHRIRRPGEALPGIGRQLDLDDDHPDTVGAVEEENDDVGEGTLLNDLDKRFQQSSTSPAL